MITEEQFKEAKELKSRIDFLEGFIKDRSNDLVATSFSLCDLYSGSKSYDINYRKDDINRFARDHKSFMRDLADYGFNMMQKELDILRLKYGKYVQ